MLQFEGDRTFALAPADLWARLSDARFLVPCIPDVERVTLCEADHAELVLRPGFSFVRGTLDLTLRVADAVAPTAARVVLHTRGVGSSSTVEAAMTLAPAPEGTHVHWVAQVKELGGLLKLAPSGLVRGAAQKVIQDAWDAVEAKLKDVSI